MFESGGSTQSRSPGDQPSDAAVSRSESRRYSAAILAIAGKDLRLEFRGKTGLIAAGMFAALVLIIFNFSRDPSSVSNLDLAPSVLWVTFAFGAVVTLNRGFHLERENAAFDGLRLAPVSRSEIYLGKLVANLVFVGVVEAVTLPLFVLFFDIDLSDSWRGIAAVAALATVGFVAVGTVFSAMVIRTRFAELMLPVLLLPFMVPPLIGATQATTRLLAGRPLSEVWGWLRLLALYDVVFVTLAALTFWAVVDE